MAYISNLNIVLAIAKSPFLCYYPKIPSFQGCLGVLCFGQLPRGFFILCKYYNILLLVCKAFLEKKIFLIFPRIADRSAF